MNFNEKENGFTKEKLPQIAFIVLFHLALGWGIVHGMKMNVISILKPRIVDIVPIPPEVKKIEPEPLIKPPTPMNPPPTVFIPRPEVLVEPTEPPVIADPVIVPPVTDHSDRRVRDDKVKDDKIVVAKHEPIRIGAVVDANACIKPAYPTNAVRNGEEGTVSLAMLIGIDGRVVDAKVEKSSGYQDLDKAARLGLSLCKFKPGSIDGVPQQAWTKILYEWELKN